MAALRPSAVAMTLPKSVLDSEPVSGASAAPEVLAVVAALLLARVRVLPTVCADGPVVFGAEEGLPAPLPDWLLPLAVPVPGAEPLLSPELASLAWFAAPLVPGLSATWPEDGPGARA